MFGHAGSVVTADTDDRWTAARRAAAQAVDYFLKEPEDEDLAEADPAVVIEELCELVETERANARAALQEERAAVAERDAAQQSLATVRCQLDASNDRVKSQERELDELKSQERQVDDERRQVLEDRRKLETQLRSERDALAKEKALNVDLKGKLTTLIVTERENLTKARRQLGESSAKVTQLRSALDAKTKEAEQERDEETRKLAEAEQEVRRLETIVGVARGEVLRHLMLHNSSQEAEEGFFDRDRVKRREEMAKSAMASIRRQLAARNERLARADVEVERAALDLETARHELGATTRDLATVRRRLDETERSLAALEIKAQHDMTAARDKHDRDVERLKAQLKRACAANASMDAALNKLANHHAATKKMIRGP